MHATELILLAGTFAGALVGGFVSGFAGFGTALTAIGIWLEIMPPHVVAVLTVIFTVASQTASLPAVFRAIEPRRVVPFMVPGLIGVPIGAWLLNILDPNWIRLGAGVIVVGFSLYMLLARARESLTWGGQAADTAIGFAGGILGGLMGLSGTLPTLWAALRGWPKLESRTVFQSFNLATSLLALGTHMWSGMLTGAVLKAAAMALPGTFLGTWLGVRTWHRVGEHGFRKAILVLLCISGVLLLAGGL